MGTGSFLRALFQDQAVLDGLRQALQEAVLHQVVGQEVHQVGVPLKVEADLQEGLWEAPPSRGRH